MPRKRKYPKSARMKRMENQLSKKTKVDTDEALESDSVSSSLGDKCINAFVDDSNNIAVNEISTCTSSALDSGGICNLEQKPKLTKKQRKEEKIVKKRAQVAANFRKDPEKKRAQVRAHFNKDPEKKRAQVRAHFHKNRPLKRMIVQMHYYKNQFQIASNKRAKYMANPYKKRLAATLYARAKRLSNPLLKKRQNRAYYRKRYDKIRAARKSRYILRKPKKVEVYRYLSKLKLHLRAVETQVVYHFQNIYPFAQKLSATALFNTACRYAATKLVNSAIEQRQEQVSQFYKAIFKVKNCEVASLTDFGDGCHVASGEPYFYETAYKYTKLKYGKSSSAQLKRKHKAACALKQGSALSDLHDECSDIEIDRECDKTPIPVDCYGQCHFAEFHCLKSGVKSKQWKCTNNCKQLNDVEINVILEIFNVFKKPINVLMDYLYTIDHGCNTERYAKRFFESHNIDSDDDTVEFRHQGHSMSCYDDDSECYSKLRILRSASVHSSALRVLLRQIYQVLRNYGNIMAFNCALEGGDYNELLKLTGIHSFDSLFTQDDNKNSDYIACSDNTGLRDPELEPKLLVEHASSIDKYQKAIYTFYDCPCCSCEMLLRRDTMSKIDLATSSNPILQQLFQYITSHNPPYPIDVFYICPYCKNSIVKKNQMPARCVLNGLQTDHLPQELANLDQLSVQLIQRAKAYQTVVRLGTYTAKVPTYNSLKACKGNMFFLPLPFHKTERTINEIQDNPNLADPELYIILNGVPTKKKVIWRSLIDITSLKAAITKLKDINWLYASVDDKSLDETAKKVLEVSNDTTSTLVEEATKEDIASFQSYTIRQLDNQLSTESDISQYKMNEIRENPLDNRQKHLDVMCFPTLFPTGNFGADHSRAVKLTNAEYIKSRLLNVDSRYRKNPAYVFFLLWEKELRELKSGIYNTLRTSSQNMSAQAMLNMLNNTDRELEASLCTVLQSVRGTKQFWFKRKGDVDCMIREFGSPTFFCTFSCAEYESPDILEYLRKVNDVPDSYDNGRLCTEDPISVSRQFSHKFHEFFSIFIKKGQVLGQVDHFFWKKEYQQRGAPHYHVLLWIRDAPKMGQDKPEDVIAFIDRYITCHIPNHNTCPELHKSVMSKQLHKCSAYCKKKYKSGGHYFQRCKFGYPRPVTSKTTLKDVTKNLKAHQKIYDLKRHEAETRVNDYNPLLLLQWGANIDVQYINETSLALANYVTSYVTKAEKSHMQDLWQEISETKSVFSRLWSFGLRCIRSRESGLYEASDMLLGDHLSEKSDTVQWINVSMSSNRRRTLITYAELQALAENDPSTHNIYCNNIRDTYYPQRPARLDDMCLYDFVAHIDFYHKDKSGMRTFKTLRKPRLPNHWLYDPRKEDEKEKYYYSLILLFVPFRDEPSLIADDETAEEAFDRLIASNDNASFHHEKLQQMLQCRTLITEIDEARDACRVQPDEDVGPTVCGEAISAMQDVANLNIDTGLSLEERDAMLNADQRLVFDSIKRHLLHQRDHEQAKCSCHNMRPLSMFVSGVGGTGKSFLIAAVKALVDSLWETDDIKCAIAAPTGLAAFNVGGVTMHRLFRLPIEHNSKTATYWSLTSESHKIMKTSLRNLKLIIIDEVSMVSSLNLTYMHLRLDELFKGGASYFGCKNILLVGDLLQLPPVTGKSVFERIDNTTIINKIGSTTAVNIWEETMTYHELTINERQKTDQEFCTMLDCVRRGFPTAETIRVLEDRVFTNPVTEKFSQLQQAGKSPVCLFPTKKSCSDFNEKMLNLLKSPIMKIECTDVYDGFTKLPARAKACQDKLNEDCNNTAGLEYILTIAIGARVMLRCNIDTASGLVNGAIGTVLAITSKRVTVKFDNIDKPYQVEKVSRKFTIMNKYHIYRAQFPLILSFAMTIHKCQGLSLDCAIIDLSDEIFADGMAYVALSRVRTLSGVHLVAFDPKSIRVSSKSLIELNRLRNLYRTDLPQYIIPQKVPTKRKMTGSLDIVPPPSKKLFKTCQYTQAMFQ